MKSKTFYSKFAKASFIKQVWAMGLTAFAYFMTMTVPLAILLNNWDANYELKAVQQEFENYLLQSDSAYVMLVVVGAFLAFVQFSYLHSSRQMDFYGSFPIRREKLFRQKVLFAYLDFVIPYTVMLIISILVGAAKNLATPTLLVYMAETWLVNQVGFFLIFLTASLAIILTGRRWVGVLGCVVLLGFGYYVQILLNSAAEYFFETHFRVDEIWWIGYLSPVYVLYQMRECVFELQDKHVLVSGKYAGLIVLFGIACMVLFMIGRYLIRIRQTEKAGQSMAFQIPSRIIHMLLSVFGGIGIGMIAMSFVYTNEIAWFFTGTIFGTACLYVLVQFMYTLDIRRTFTYKWQIVAVEFAAVLFCALYSFDLIGYDTYLPAQEKLESIAICYSNENLYNNYHIDGKYVEALDYILENMALEPDDRTYAMLEETVKGTGEYWNSDGESYGEDATINRVYVSYHLKNGKSVDRMYMVPLAEYKELFVNYYENETYRDLLVPSLMIEKQSEDVTYECIKLYYGGEEGILYESMDDSDKSYSDEMAALTAIYNQDMKKLDSAVFVEEIPVAKLYIGYYLTGYYSWVELPIYEECTETLARLKQMGHDPVAAMDVEHIEKIQVEIYDPYNTGTPETDVPASADYQIKETVAAAADVKTLEFTEKEEIAKILEYMVDDHFRTIWTETEPNYYICVYMKDTTYEVCCYGDFLKGHIPALVLEQ